MKKVFLWLLCIPLFCGCGKESAVSVNGVSLDEDAISVVIGSSKRLTAVISPENASNQSVVWTVSDNSVADVSGDGTVTAIAVGQTVVTVETVDGGFTDECQVTVTEREIPVAGIVLNKESLELSEGETEQLVAAVVPENATDKTVVWTSEDDGIVTVDAEGTVAAVAEGTAGVIASSADGKCTDTCMVTVLSSAIRVEGVEVTPDKVGVKVGEEAVLSYTVFPEDADNRNVIWSSSREDVVSVDENGRLTGLSIGTAEVTVTTEDGGFSDVCSVEVTELGIYVAGYAGNKAYLWINGAPSVLSEEYSKGKSVFVSEDNVVYVAGELNSTPAYWKGSESVTLSGSMLSTANAIYVDGSDVYVGGYVMNSSFMQVAAVWKNGEEHILSEKLSAVNDILVDNGDVYAVGNDEVLIEEYGYTENTATLWKNYEVEYYFTRTGEGGVSRPSYARAVFIEDGAVYAGGCQAVPYSLNDEGYVWKETQELWHFPMSETGEVTGVVVEDIFVSGGDVYSAGYKNTLTNSYGVIWKNGEELWNGNDYGTTSEFHSVFVNGSDVYFTGSVAGDDWVFEGKVWKNGEELYSLESVSGDEMTYGYSVYVR